VEIVTTANELGMYPNLVTSAIALFRRPAEKLTGFKIAGQA
jgi:hypothetical protein